MIILIIIINRLSIEYHPFKNIYNNYSKILNLKYVLLRKRT